MINKNIHVASFAVAQIYCKILEFLDEIIVVLDELNFRVARFFISNRQLNDFTFAEVFGVSIIEAELIYQRLGRYLARRTRRNMAVTGKEAFLMVMFYLRTGCSLKAAGLAVRGKRQTVALNIRRFVNGVLEELSNEISMDKSEKEWNTHMIQMYLFCGIPLVVGAVDGTHIPVANIKDDNFYFSRYGTPSINVLVACDSNKKILYVNANYPGSYHDCLVYRLSSLCKTIDQGWRPANKYGFLADFAYPAKGCLFSYRRPHLGEEQVYRRHRKGRSVIERTFGELKGQFRLLEKGIFLKDRSLVSRIILCCCCMYNYLLRIRGKATEKEKDFQLPQIPPITDCRRPFNSQVIQLFKNLQQNRFIQNRKNIHRSNQR